MRVLEGVLGAIGATIVIAFDVLTSPDVLAAVVSVLWRAEDMVTVPIWIRWLVLAGLVTVAISAINRKVRTGVRS